MIYPISRNEKHLCWIKTRLSTLVVNVGLPSKIIKCKYLSSLSHFTTMSRVVKNNLPSLHLLTSCPEHQREFLLETATPEPIHALVQSLYNLRHGNTPVSKEVKRNLKKHIDALVNLVGSSVPYKTKKHTKKVEDLYKIC